VLVADAPNTVNISSVDTEDELAVVEELVDSDERLVDDRVVGAVLSVVSDSENSVSVVRELVLRMSGLIVRDRDSVRLLRFVVRGRDSVRLFRVVVRGRDSVRLVGFVVVPLVTVPSVIVGLAPPVTVPVV
jgi:hypothetical protein